MFEKLSKRRIPRYLTLTRSKIAALTQNLKGILCALLLLTLFSLNFVFADVPNEINYQGRLKEYGQPVSGERKMSFKLYKTATEGIPLWSSGDLTVTVSSGVFNVILRTEVDWLEKDYWLETTISDKILAPREKITAQPYALHARTAEDIKKASGTVTVSVGGFTILYVSTSGVIIQLAGATPVIISTEQITLQGTLSMGNVWKITDLPAPTQSSDAARKEDVDKVSQEVNSSLTTHISTTSPHPEATSIGGKPLPQGAFVGTTDSQPLANKRLGSDLDAAGYKITNVSTPTAPGDAAHKGYVDSQVGLASEGSGDTILSHNSLAAPHPNATSIGGKALPQGEIAGTNDVQSFSNKSLGSNLDAAGRKIVGLAAATGPGDSVRYDEFSQHQTRHQSGGPDALSGTLDVNITGSASYASTAGTASTVTDGAITDQKVAPGVSADKIASGSVNNTELGYLDGVTSGIQGQINGKAPQARQISTSGGLTGGGDLTGDRTISIAAGGVNTEKLADGNVTPAKLAAKAATSDKLSVALYTDNIVLNPSFEDGTNAWAVVEGAGTFDTWTGERTEGDASLRLNGGGSLAVGSRAIPLTPGDLYIVRCKYKGSVVWATGLIIRMNERSSYPGYGDYVTSSNRIGYAEFVNGGISNSWTTSEFTYTVPSGIYWGSISFYAWTGSSGYLYVDEVEVRKKLGTAHLDDAAVTTPKIADGSVTTPKIADGINANKLGTGSVDNTELGYLDGVTSGVQGQLNGKAPQARQISTSGGLTGGGDLTGDRTISIADGGVSTPKIADGSVTTPKIADGSVTTPKLADGNVTPPKLAAKSITSDKLGIHPYTDNLILNPSFEDGTNAWAVVYGGGAYWYNASVIKTEGTYCVYVQGFEGAFGIGNRAIALSPGDVYIVRVKFTKDAGWGGTFFVQMSEKASYPSGDYVTAILRDSYTEFFAANPSGAWTTYEFTYTVPSGIYWGSLLFQSWGASSGGTYIDEVEVRKKIGTPHLDDVAVTDPKVAPGISAAKVAGGTVDNTEYGYLDGVTSGIQSQLNGKTPNTRTVSGSGGLTGGGDLTGDRTLQIADLGVTTQKIADQAVTEAKVYRYQPSTNILYSADTERNTANTGYVTLKQFRVTMFGTVRVYFESKNGNGSDSTYVCVLSNETFAGERYTIGTTYTPSSIDVPVSGYTVISVQAKTTGSYAAYIRNVRIQATATTATSAVLQD